MFPKLRSMQRQKNVEGFSPFDLLSDEILFAILDLLDENPIDKKSFSLVCKSFYIVESRHRKTLKPLRSELLTSILNRYPHVTHLDLSLCPRITDYSLSVISIISNSTLRSIDLSRSKFFSHAGLSTLALKCSSLVEIDLSNGTDLTDSAAVAISEARNLERLWLARCKLISDIGIGCIVVRCRKLTLISLKWCVRVTDLGVGLIAVKCKEIRSLDLSYLPITNKCLPSILKLEHLEDLILMGCLRIDDDGLTTLKQGCKSLQNLNMSSCQNVTHVGLSSLTNGAESLRQIILAYGSPITLALADSLRKLSMLQSIKLDGSLVTSSGLKAIGNWCVSLRELGLSKCIGVMDEGLVPAVIKHKELKKLDITCCREITYISISNITNSCRNLTSLKMESCSLVSKEAFVLIGKYCRFLVELDLTDNEIDDEGLKSISRCSGLASLKLGICLNITDEGLTHVGMYCPKLTELDLYRTAGITDSGIAAIAHGCPGLEIINISYCKDITDISLISLSKCLRLSTLECRGCPCISSVGLAAISIRCRKLTKLDIKKCFNINDASMVPLAHFSQNLRQVNLSYCSITDVGLLSLASISCLESMTILHLRGLTADGLAAALLACRGLTKVKLHASFKPLIPQPLIEHIKARGCVFQWRDKSYQVDLDPKNWKLQSGDLHAIGF